MMVTMGTKVGHSHCVAISIKMKLGRSVYFHGTNSPWYFTIYALGKQGRLRNKSVLSLATQLVSQIVL